MAALWRQLCSVMTATMPLLSVSVDGFAGKVYCVPEAIFWYVIFLAVIPR